MWSYSGLRGDEAMTKQEYLDNLQKNADKVLTANSPKVKKSRMIIAAILAIGSIIGIGVGFIGTSSSKEKAYSSFSEELSSGNCADVPFEFLDYKDTFELWNECAVGNDINVLLDGGALYSRNGLAIYPDAQGQSTIIQDGKSAPYTIASKMSYINVCDGIAFYRSDMDRSIYRLELNSKRNEMVFQGNVGEVFITNDTIYCIDYSKENALISMDLQGNNQMIVVDEPVSSFLVCGETILYLDTTQHLYSTVIGSGTSSLIVSDIERFYINGLIYAESKNTLFCFTTTGGGAKEVYVSENDTLRMVSVIDDVVFFQKDGELQCLTDGVINTISTSKHDLYSCLLKCEDGSLKSVVYDKDDSGLIQTIMEFTAAPAVEVE